MTGDGREQRPQLEHPPLFGPCRMHRGQVDAEHPARIAGGHDFEERVARSSRTVPLVVRRPLVAEERERAAGARAMMRHPEHRRETRDHGRLGSLLQQHEIGCGMADHGGDRPFTPGAAAQDVVVDDSQDAASVGFSISTR